MAAAGPEINDPAYLAACSRVLSHVVDLVQGRGLAMSVGIDPGRASRHAIVTTHQIQLTYGRSTRCLGRAREPSEAQLTECAREVDRPASVYLTARCSRTRSTSLAISSRCPDPGTANALAPGGR